jgi:Fur family ferric uptake transcriptional regulator
MSTATVTAQELAGEFQARLSSRGFRSTRQRTRIAEIFFDMGGHHSVEEIHALLRQQTEGAGHATIYRTMKLLVDCGMAKARHFGDGLTRYEAFEEGEHHDHLICTDCGMIVEFENDTIESLQDAIALQHGFTLKHHRMELYGLCSTCG